MLLVEEHGYVIGGRLRNREVQGDHIGGCAAFAEDLRPHLEI